MHPLTVAVIRLACIIGGVALGMAVGRRLRDAHLSDASRDAVKLSAESA